MLAGSLLQSCPLGICSQFASQLECNSGQTPDWKLIGPGDSPRPFLPEDFDYALPLASLPFLQE